jgi:hypothetical protein
MPKFRPYESPALFLAKHFSFFRDIYSLYDEYILRQPALWDISASPSPDKPLSEFKKTSYFLGGFNPILSSGKDIADTFKPYKSFYHVIRDAIQPLNGLGNIVKGVFDIVASPLILLYNTARYAKLAIQKNRAEYFTMPMTVHGIKAAGHFTGGLTSIVRGIGQIATTPLMWLRIPFRGMITAVTGRPTLSDEVQEGVNNLAELAKKQDKTITDAKTLDKGIVSLIRKSRKAEVRNQNFGNAQKVSDDDIEHLIPFANTRSKEIFSGDQPASPPYSYTYDEDAKNKYFITNESEHINHYLKVLGFFGCQERPEIKQPNLIKDTERTLLINKI